VSITSFHPPHRRRDRTTATGQASRPLANLKLAEMPGIIFCNTKETAELARPETTERNPIKNPTFGQN
jgi:hypothetical protein